MFGQKPTVCPGMPLGRDIRWLYRLPAVHSDNAVVNFMRSAGSGKGPAGLQGTVN